jgi:WD40 repeat protein
VFEGDWSAVLAVAWSPDGDTLASGGMDGAVRLWDAETWELRIELEGRKHELSHAVWSPAGDLIAAGGDRGTVRLWDLSTGRIAAVLEGGRRPIADGSRLLPRDAAEPAEPAGDPTDEAMLGAFMKALITPIRSHISQVDKLAFSPDGSLIAAAIRGGVVRVWDVETARQLGRPFEHPGEVLDIAWAPDGAGFAAALQDGRLVLWSLADSLPPVIRTAHDGAINDLDWTGDGKRIATAGADGKVQIWRPDWDAPLLALPGCAGRAGSVAWSPDGERLAIGSPAGRVTVVDPTSGKRLTEVEVEHSLIVNVAWSPDGSIITAAAVRIEQGFVGEILRWNALSGKPLETLGGQSYYAASVSFDPRSEHLVSTGGSGLRIHRLSDGAWLALDAFPLDETRTGGVAYHESGLFTGDEEAFDQLFFQVGALIRGTKLATGTELADTFHRPDLVEAFLAGKSIALEAERGADE